MTWETIKPDWTTDMSDETLDTLERTLMTMLDHEQSVAYEFLHNDYNCALSAAIMDHDDEYLEQAKSIKEKVDRIVNTHNSVKDLVKRLVAQAKLANELHENCCKRSINQ